MDVRALESIRTGEGWGRGGFVFSWRCDQATYHPMMVGTAGGGG